MNERKLKHLNTKVVAFVIRCQRTPWIYSDHITKAIIRSKKQTE